MEEWKEYKLGEILTIKYGKDHKRLAEGNIPIYGSGGIMRYGEESLYEGPSILIPRKGSLNNIMYSDKPFWTVDTMFWTIINEDLANPLFVYYSICKKDFASLNVGSAVPSLTVPVIEDIDILLPSKEIQNRIVTILKSLDDKIKVNRRINDNFRSAFLVVMLILLLTSLRNDNLEQQAMAIFDKVFPAIASGEDTIGSMITPKRGKGLLSKDAVEGNVPVVAGGLEPSTYHNESNTIAPVITISASGANAGYVNLWHIPVWSSDSSFIDGSMTENVYFWYVMLKKRQKEIFDAQTGSAQPHIYPRHIAEMPLGKFEQPDVDKFTEIVTPMFEIRGKNMKESERLASIRDTLLPKLMSGELKLENINM